MASDLLEIWKKVVIEETTRKKNGAVDNKSSGKAEISMGETVNIEKAQKAGAVKVDNN